MTTRAVLAPGRTPGGSLRRARTDAADAPASGGTPSASGERATPLRAFRTPVRGHAFAAAPGGSSAPEAGLRARLAREPSNPADPLAVAVWVDNEQPWRIGYLDRGVAARVAPRIDAGLQVDARVEGWVVEPEGRWHRPLVRLVPDAVRVVESGGQGVDEASNEALWRRPPGVSRRVIRR